MKSIIPRLLMLSVIALAPCAAMAYSCAYNYKSMEEKQKLVNKTSNTVLYYFVTKDSSINSKGSFCNESQGRVYSDKNTLGVGDKDNIGQPDDGKYVTFCYYNSEYQKYKYACGTSVNYISWGENPIGYKGYYNIQVFDD